MGFKTHFNKRAPAQRKLHTIRNYLHAWAPGEASSRGCIYNKYLLFEQQLINRFGFLQKKVK